jgi:hypothetical protein
MPLQAPEGSVFVKMSSNRLKLIPLLQAAMGVYRAFDQGIHRRVSRENRFSSEKMRAAIENLSMAQVGAL